jgi:hypothetical protein
MPNDPSEHCREYHSAEDDPECCLRQIPASRLLGKLAGDEFEIALDQREIGSGLVGPSAT